jgi:hypothetical protein
MQGGGGRRLGAAARWTGCWLIVLQNAAPSALELAITSDVLPAVRTAMSIGPTVGEHLVAENINLSKSTFNLKSLTHGPIKYFLSK